jgi:hypothetical protein
MTADFVILNSSRGRCRPRDEFVCIVGDVATGAIEREAAGS